jgi:hypothetical protein
MAFGCRYGGLAAIYGHLLDTSAVYRYNVPLMVDSVHHFVLVFHAFTGAFTVSALKRTEARCDRIPVGTLQNE